MLESCNERRIRTLRIINNAVRIRKTRREMPHVSEGDGRLSASDRTQRVDCDWITAGMINLDRRVCFKATGADVEMPLARR